MRKVLIINGPNMNFLGKREVCKYGKSSLSDMISLIKKKYDDNNCIEFIFYQSNYEGKIIDKIHSFINKIDFLIINPAGFSYNSFSILDAILSINVPYIEIHVTNIFSRVGRENSIFSKNAISVISGFGIYGYLFAVDYLFFKFFE